MKKKYIIPQSDIELLIDTASIMVDSAPVDPTPVPDMEGDAPTRTFRPSEMYTE